VRSTVLSLPLLSDFPALSFNQKSVHAVKRFNLLRDGAVGQGVKDPQPPVAPQLEGVVLVLGRLERPPAILRFPVANVRQNLIRFKKIIKCHFVLK